MYNNLRLSRKSNLLFNKSRPNNTQHSLITCVSKTEANAGIFIFAVWILSYPCVGGPLSLLVPLTIK